MTESDRPALELIAPFRIERAVNATVGVPRTGRD